MLKYSLYLLSIVLFLISCDKSVSTSAADVKVDSSKSIVKNIPINDSGYEFSMDWPKELTDQGVNPTIKYNETSGVLEIFAGNKIQIEVTDEAMSLNDIKKELQGNQMFTYKFHEETDDGYIFQAVLPDGSTYFYNFLVQKTIGTTTYLFKNRDNEEFTLRDIKLMKKIAASAK